MSVVNKMLQDLETRQSHGDEITADYQAPPQKQSKLLVLLLVLAIAAIIFALADFDQLFGETNSNNVMETPKTQALPSNASKKMTMVSAKEQEASEQPQKITVIQANTKISTANSETQIEVPSDILEKEQMLTEESVKASVQLEAKQFIDTQEKPQETHTSAESATQEVAVKASSFSMSGSSLESNSKSLKQRIVESLAKDNLDLARSLLYQLLEAEPANIKARKKLASLLFSQGNYAQSKQILTQGIELHPAQGDLRMMLARLYVVQKQPSQAINILAVFSPSSGNQVEYLGYRAALAQQQKQTKLAKSDYKILTNIESTNAKWWLGLGIAEDQLGELNKAVLAYQKALSLEQLESSVNDFMQQRISVLAGPR
jgi:MSHA biogenesis protein MshN